MVRAVAPVRRRRIFLFALVAAIALAVDIGTKVLVVATLEGRDPVQLLGGVVELVVIRNTGAAFSLGEAYTAVLTVFALAVVGFIIYSARRLRSAGWAVALGLILAGAAGNLIDRLFRAPAPFQGGVVDFVSVGWWPVFNVADSCLCVGVALVVLLVLRGIGVDGRRGRDEQVSDSSS